MDFNLNLGLNMNIGKADAPTSAGKATEPSGIDVYDAIVLGSGPSGLSAALYLSRKGRSVIVIGARKGGQVVDTSVVENYLGFASISGEELVNSQYGHVVGLGVPVVGDDEAISADLDGDVKSVTLASGKTYRGRTVIAATGSKARRLGVPGEEELRGRGVAYCAICDGPLFRGKDVIVAGGGNSAVEAAIDLSKTARSVTLIHRSQLRGDKVTVDALYSLDNVNVILDTRIVRLEGDKRMTGAVVADKGGGESTVEASGLFVEVGYDPSSGLFRDKLEINGKGEIVVSEKCETNVKGVFASGDVTSRPYKQIIIAASEGAVAALSANEYLNTL